MEYCDLYREHVGVMGADRRITNVITKHWEDVRGNKLMPSEIDLDPEVLDGVLDNCFLIRTEELLQAGSHKYVYIGKNILEAYGSDETTPKDYHDVDPLSHKDKFEEVIKTLKPVVQEGEFINKDGKLVKFRQCLIPLAQDGRTIDSIFGGMRFKVF